MNSFGASVLPVTKAQSKYVLVALGLLRWAPPWLLRPRARVGQFLGSSRGLVVLAGVDGAAFQAIKWQSAPALRPALPAGMFSGRTAVLGREKDRTTHATVA